MVAAAVSAACRYGGEEFCLLLPETNEDNAAIWANRIRQRLAEMVIEYGDQKLNITASFGIVQWMDDTTSPEQIVDMADQALLVAKCSGRDRVVNFHLLADSEAEVGELHQSQRVAARCRGPAGDDYARRWVVSRRHGRCRAAAFSPLPHCAGRRWQWQTRRRVV